MRRRVFEADGNEAIPEAVLHGDDLGEYRRDHPRPVVHQITGYRKPENECDECQAPLRPDEGALCLYCALRYEEEKNS